MRKIIVWPVPDKLANKIRIGNPDFVVRHSQETESFEFSLLEPPSRGELWSGTSLLTIKSSQKFRWNYVVVQIVSGKVATLRAAVKSRESCKVENLIDAIYTTKLRLL